MPSLSAHPLRWLLPLLALLLLTACGSNPSRTSNISAAQKAEVIEIARSLIGKPYTYGGNSPAQGFDCSGLVQYSHRQAGVRLPRTTDDQYDATQRVRRSALQPGDLVFFRTGGRHFVSHVGIYIGNDRFIHAPSRGKQVSIANLKSRYWKRHYLAAGRIN